MENQSQTHESGKADPGIAKELGQEAIDDIKSAAKDMTNAVSTIASDTAENISHTAQVAYERPTDFIEYVFRSAERFARRRPLDAVAVAAGVAFVVGALSQVGRR